MPLMESLIIAPTSFVLSSIFSIIEAGISKNYDGDGAEGDGPDWSAFDNIKKQQNQFKKHFIAQHQMSPNPQTSSRFVRQVMVEMPIGNI